MKRKQKQKRIDPPAAVTENDRQELAMFRRFLSVKARAEAAGGRDAVALYDAIYGPDGSGEDRRDFTRKH